ncbi:MAG TPA: patatin-like phospholipase family protein [Polyangia bacterium]
MAGTTPPSSSPAALVLGSGGARGAYEVGVAQYLFEELPRTLGRPPTLSILCGTSAGALNTYGLACFAERPLSAVALLARRWSSLRLREMLSADHVALARFVRTLLGCTSMECTSSSPPPASIDRGFLAPAPFRRAVLAGLPPEQPTENLRSGLLRAVSLTATEVATGRTTIFVQRGDAAGALPPSHLGTTICETPLTPEHALASSAIPLLFAPVAIRGQSYCDGSLRQSVPLSPAVHLGARRVLVVTTQHGFPRVLPLEAEARKRGAANPLYLLGKAVNALTLGHVDDDIERLATINHLLDAGMRAFGPAFSPKLNQELHAAGHREVVPVTAEVIRPSESLGRLAAEYLRTREFRARNRGPGVRLLLRLAETESPYEADLASYLLFDGGFAQELMRLGYDDARAANDRLAALFADEREAVTPTPPAAGAAPATDVGDPSAVPRAQ